MKILVAIEQSQYSTKALERAVELAKQEGAALTALVVAETVKGIEEVYPDTLLEEKLLAQAKGTAENAKSFAKGQGVTLQTLVQASSSPEEAILDQAAKLGVDLIVVGSRGKKGIARFLLGSVASTVVTHAPCSVLVVR